MGPDDQAFIDASMTWFREAYGEQRLMAPVVLPTDEFFPGAYAGTPAEVRTVFDRLCRYVGADPARFAPGVAGDPGLEGLVEERPADADGHLAVGHRRTADGRTFIDLGPDPRRDPLLIVAGIARELAHDRLRDAAPPDPTRVDNERTTDLLTVFLGAGIFAANAAVHVTKSGRGITGIGMSLRFDRLGYLDARQYGYALARYTLLRAEPDPAWARYLATDPRTYLRRSLRHLARGVR